jgi:hypothetical protein
VIINDRAGSKAIIIIIINSSLLLELWHACIGDLTTAHVILAPATQCNQHFMPTGDSPDNGIFPGEHRQVHYRALYLTA